MKSKIVFGLIATMLTAPSAFAVKEGGGGDPRVATILNIGQMICDSSLAKLPDYSASFTGCTDMIKRLEKATSAGTGGVGFVTKQLFDPMGFEKVAQFDLVGPTIRINETRWGALNKKEGIETIAIELAGLLKISSRYAFGQLMASHLNDRGEIIAPNPRNTSCSDPSCEEQAQLQYFFDMASPLDFTKWRPSAYLYSYPLSKNQEGWPTDTWPNYWNVLYINTTSLKTMGLINFFGPLPLTDTPAEVSAAFVGQDLNNLLIPIESSYDSSGKPVKTTLGNFELRLAALSDGWVIIALRGSGTDAVFRTFRFQ